MLDCPVGGPQGSTHPGTQTHPQAASMLDHMTCFDQGDINKYDTKEVYSTCPLGLAHHYVKKPR